MGGEVQNMVPNKRPEGVASTGVHNLEPPFHNMTREDKQQKSAPEGAL